MTFGPDDQAYRFTAKDPDADYAATRFDVTPATKSLSGKFVYTNRGLSVDRESQANAGTTNARQHVTVSACLLDFACQITDVAPTCTVRHARLRVHLSRGPNVMSVDLSRAGSFCTKDYAVGVAANAIDDDVDYASFFAFGYGEAGSTETEDLPVMRKVGHVKRDTRGCTCTWGCHVVGRRHMT